MAQGYNEFLKELLKPLGVYDLEEGAGAGELSALGDALDSIDLDSEGLENESTTVNATDYGIRLYEELFGYTPVYDDNASRRKAISALLMIDDGSFTQTALCQTIAGCGIAANVEETQEKFTVEITFPGYLGIPDNIDEIKSRIEKILPCHLNVIYVYVYTTWEELIKIGTWGDIEEKAMTWNDMARYSKTDDE